MRKSRFPGASDKSARPAHKRGMPETPEYQVLARKYRPQSFDDLLGHDAMVRTLRHAFEAGRIAHAFILTGVRGVGKTTTARIMARALNYETDEVDRPTVDMRVQGKHCRAIAESRHPDVIEMDAASRTGVGDIRELIEGVRYAPVEGRYKVYIIDEVHMLSNSAFNALLKTLEEPPPHVKFIFATTEIRKVPVTVLSRCQRFDLRRFDAETLAGHLKSIADKEGATIDDDALLMIARAAEGSVRDGLSLLDQAIIQHGDEAVSAEAVREMLGLVDRTLTWDLLDAAMKGDSAAALNIFRDQYNAGAEPAAVLRDLLDIVHLLTRTKAAGPSAAAHGAAGEADAARGRQMSEGLALPALTRAWSLLMKALEESMIAPDPAAATEIGLIRLAYAAGLPTPDDAIRMLNEQSGASSGRPGPSHSGLSSGGGARAMAGGGTVAVARETSPQLAPAADQGPVINSLADIARLAGQHRDAMLRARIESMVRPVIVEPGRLEIAVDEAAPQSLAGDLGQALKRWTGQQWIVSIVRDPGGIKTLRESRDEAILAHPAVKSAFDLFPDARITKVTPIDEDETPT
ncbi:DNA polymerase III subunit gamma/tau [Parvularcula sp. LCG005]|uniref:DNA polymerase III subunit gamma/tau n=1 Tax=Parvularcula sp. LCG005 TaxID=3078805 RepID=UPI002941F102|nr:DNA polymerase III subunit gamma/tau [Parvularcula sp. LCG005]WOI54826.1 DNA polymerase III subunit gamma/tau [Parvularcula sp. LCG005]